MPRSISTLRVALALSICAAACATDTTRPLTPNIAAGDLSRDGVTLRDNDNDDGNDDGNTNAFTYALIGDTPYGQAKRDSFPAFVELINADPAVERVLHAGDIKAGSSSPCTDAYFADIRQQFDRFEDPLVYTPGDNEWTDCHVAVKNNGLYWPTERLIAVRNVFFDRVGKTLGRRGATVTSQGRVDRANRDYVENVLWSKSRFVFAAVNIPGTNNDRGPWTSTPPLPNEVPANAALFPTQAEEQVTRARATEAWIKRTFKRARESNAKGVVLLFQADMWDGTLANRSTTISGYDDIVTQIGLESAAFGKPVLLVNGDSHLFRVDTPFTPSSPLFVLHPNTPIAPNVTRVVMNGSTNPSEYVRLTIDPRVPNGIAPWSFQEVLFR